MIIAAFDLGRSVGFACGDSLGFIKHECWSLPKETGALLSQFESKLNGLGVTPAIIAYETPFINFARQGRGERLIVKRTFGAAGALERRAYDLGAKTVQYESRSLRKRFCGTAKATEAAIKRACSVRGHYPLTDHEADALLVWYAAAMDHGNGG